MGIDKFLTSKLFKGIMIGLMALILLLIGFGLGMTVGIKKSEFSCRWRENRPMMEPYGRNGGFFNQLNGHDFMNANGAIGQVSKIEGAVITVTDRDNTEKPVLTDGKTAIEISGKPAKISDLKVGDMAVVIGDPNDSGQIQAKFIRVMSPISSPFPPNPAYNGPATPSSSLPDAANNKITNQN